MSQADKPTNTAHAELLETNRQAWNAQVRRQNRWTQCVSTEQVQRAREGNVEIVLTPKRLVPNHWFPPLAGCRTLLMAGGGGQQGPLLAAAGAEVTVLDLSDEQLVQDRKVAEREGLNIRTIQSSMDNMEQLGDDEFELIVHPCSNCFVPDLTPVWSEAARVLRKGGTLISGFCNPLIFLFDEEKLNTGKLEVEFRLPYSDAEQLSKERLAKLRQDEEPMMFGHSLTDQMALQLRAGFVMQDLYEDFWGEEPTRTEAVELESSAADSAPQASASDPTGLEQLDRHIASFLATKCLRS